MKEAKLEVEKCNLNQGVLERGIAQGMQLGKTEGKNIARIEDIKTLMTTCNVSADEAMNMLNIAQDIRPSVIASIHSENK